MLCGAFVACAHPLEAGAQSAADKATARRAATEGITLFDAGKYAESLDKMRRAQALYDAPVHLLYIARAQVKLGQLVDAAENYRLLVRYNLGESAPPAFVDAVADGKKELAELEPRIPTLRVEVKPTVENTELEIDDKAVAAAVIGIDRPINPGSHRVEVRAPGHEPAEATVDVKEGAHESVTLELSAAQGAAAAQPDQQGSATPGDAAVRAPASPSKIGFLLGARLGLSIPAGTLETLDSGTAVKTTDVFKAGGAIELHGGLRFARLFTGVVFGQFHKFTAGEEIGERLGLAATSDLELKNAASGVDLGIGLIVGTPRNRLGGFGEVDLLYHSFLLDSDIEGGQCDKLSTTYSGPGLRVGGGAAIPIGKSFQLTPLANVTVSQFTTRKFDLSGGVACGDTEQDLTEGDRQATHTLFFLGVGGDFVLGSDE